MTQRPVIEQVFQVFHTSTWIVTGVDMDDIFALEPLQRHIMLSASAEEH